MGVANIYTKNAFGYTFDQKYGIILFQFWRFLDDTHTKRLWKSNKKHDDIICSKIHFKGLAPFKEAKEVLIHIRFILTHLPYRANAKKVLYQTNSHSFESACKALTSWRQL